MSIERSVNAWAADRFRATRSGAVAGTILGGALSLVLLAVWAYLALGPQVAPGAAFAVTVLLSGVVSFPALLVASGDVGAGTSLAGEQTVVILLPLLTWLIVGTAAGAAGDLLRLVTRWFD